MSQETDRQRDKRARIERLRERVRAVTPPNAAAQLANVIKGLLDLLDDEL